MRTEAAGQLVGIGHFRSGAINAEQGLGFRFAHAVIGALERQQGSPLQLFQRRAESAFEERPQQFIELPQHFAGGIGREVALGQAPAVILHLLEEFVDRSEARHRARRNGHQRVPLHLAIAPFAEQRQKLPLQPRRRRSNHLRQTGNVPSRRFRE